MARLNRYVTASVSSGVYAIIPCSINYLLRAAELTSVQCGSFMDVHLIDGLSDAALWYHAESPLTRFVTLDHAQAQAARELGLPA